MSEFPGIEIHDAGGLRDFGQEIREDIAEIVHPHDRELPDDIARGLPHELPTVTVMQKQATSAHYRTLTLAANVPLQLNGPYPNRASIVVTNQGAATAFLGSDNEVIPNAPNTVALPAGASRTFTHTAKIFAVAGGATTVDVVEEHFA